MMTLDQALVFMKNRESAFDNRDVARFAMFVPFDRLAEAGIEPEDDETAETWGDVRSWTEDEVLKQLRRDAEFGLEKAIGERGISANCMFIVVNMWCEILQNGLRKTDYYGYGRVLFERVLNHYGWETEVTQ